jgi:hypothetical protein
VRLLAVLALVAALPGATPAAFYDAGSFSTDTSKVWAWSAWSF